ncbi:MAG: site-specific integrase [Thermoguttaceae bacterium]|jgi:integrase/recombinase XerD
MTSSWQLTREMFLSIEEVESLLEHLRAHGREASGRARLSADIDQLVIEGLLFSGLRTTEFCRLTLADTVIGQKQSVFVVTGLRGRDRTVHVPAEVSQLVEQFVRDTRPSLLPEDVDPNDPTQPLIFGERKNPLERTGLYRRVVRVLSAAGLGARASVQLLRHTYGYLAYVRTNGNLLFVQRQLGHAHPMVTSIYAQFVDESYATLAEQVYRQARLPRP